MFFQHRECFPGIHWKCCVTAFVNVISNKLSPKQAAGTDSFFRSHPSLAGCDKQRDVPCPEQWEPPGTTDSSLLAKSVVLLDGVGAGAQERLKRKRWAQGSFFWAALKHVR